MIQVEWPLDWDIDDDVVCDWLDGLVKLQPDTLTFELGADKDKIYFAREEDAIAFKLKFGR